MAERAKGSGGNVGGERLQRERLRQAFQPATPSAGLLRSYRLLAPRVPRLAEWKELKQPSPGSELMFAEPSTNSMAWPGTNQKQKAIVLAEGFLASVRC
jgi:hypothetical protein